MVVIAEIRAAKVGADQDGADEDRREAVFFAGEVNLAHVGASQRSCSQVGVDQVRNRTAKPR